MRTIDKSEILVPILEKYYPSSNLFRENETQFYNDYHHLMRSDGNTHLEEDFGVAILIVKISSANEAKQILNLDERNSKFEKCIYEGNKPEIDEILFDKDAKFSFNRSVFKSKERLNIDIAEKHSKSKNESVSFSLFVSVAKAEGSNHHIVSYIFTTYDKQKVDEQMNENEENAGEVYVQLSSHQIIDLINDKKDKFRRSIKELDDDLAELFIIDKNSFFGLNLWRPEWKKETNYLDVLKYIKENPYYFFSLLTLDKSIFRRNYKNVMDYLGWGFSASRVHCGLFSRNLYISITLKPLKERYEYIGHDGTEFRAWEILALQNYLLNRIDINYGKRDKKNEKELDGLVNELDEVYDFNAFIKMVGKGDIWIKFNRYLQNAIGISFYHELYINRYNRSRQEKESAEILELTRTSTALSGLIFAAIFLTISIFFIERADIKCADLLGNFSAHELFNPNNFPIFVLSILLTLTISIISIFTFSKYLKYSKYYNKSLLARLFRKP